MYGHDEESTAGFLIKIKKIRLRAFMNAINNENSWVFQLEDGETVIHSSFRSPNAAPYPLWSDKESHGGKKTHSEVFVG